MEHPKWLLILQGFSPHSFLLCSNLVCALSQHGIWLPRESGPRGQAPGYKCSSSLCLHRFAKISLANTSHVANPRDSIGEATQGCHYPETWITGGHQCKRTPQSAFWSSVIHVSPAFKIKLPSSQDPHDIIPFQH